MTFPKIAGWIMAVIGLIFGLFFVLDRQWPNLAVCICLIVWGGYIARRYGRR